MTILQLKVAIAINELGSISNASNKLDISQPNISSYLKTLEKEIGFEIFTRTKAGVMLTEKGHAFLIHAKKILAEQKSIMDIKKLENIYRLRVGSINYQTSIEPFLDICEKHRDDEETDFRYLNVSIEEGIKALGNFDLDILVAPALKSQLTGLKNVCKQNGLSLISLCDMPAVIKVRKGHPAILDGRCENLTQGSDAMKEYPYVTYKNLSDDTSATSYNDSDFVQCSYKMYVDGMDTRLRIISKTNAFSFGIMVPQNILDRYNLVAYPVPGITLEVFCIIRKNDTNKDEIKEYIDYLKDELNIK